MTTAETRLKRLLIELDDLAEFDKSGKIVTFDADKYEKILERADGYNVKDHFYPFPPLDLPIS